MDKDCGIKLKREKKGALPKWPTNAAPIAERSIQADSVRTLKAEQLRRQLEAERLKAERDVEPPVKARYVPAEKPDDRLWDDAGKLLGGDIDTDYPVLKPPTPRRSEEPTPTKSERPKSGRRSAEETQKFYERQERSGRRQDQSPTKPKAAPLSKEFYQRQEDLIEKHKELANQEENRKFKYINRQSEVMVDRMGGKPPKKRVYEPEEYSFMPDMSATQGFRESQRMPCKESQAHSVMHQIEMKGAQVEVETESMRECTFMPDMSLSREGNEAAIAEMAEIRQNEPGRREPSGLYDCKPRRNPRPRDADEEVPVIGPKATDPPKTTRQLIQMMKLLKSDGGDGRVQTK